MSLLLGDMLVRYKADVTDLSVKSGIAKADIASTAATAKAADAGLGNLSGATKFAHVLGTALLVGSIAAVGLGVASVKMAGDFQQSTNQLVTSAGEIPANLDMVRKSLLQMSVDTTTSPTELLKALSNLNSARSIG